MEYKDNSIQVEEPVCYLSWVGHNRGMHIAIYRDFNWFQRRMLAFCFGLEYKKNIP